MKYLVFVLISKIVVAGCELGDDTMTREDAEKNGVD
ncbi:hypothetical protein HNQ41_000088 [Texcoconibacillus texcoconensis]|uniref:Uncharacterized protein n=1 Tax=Texcoconibacillus texcoconensis TaxID=1095777 RepID=A0A840QIX9_9BACI|nr:hypothetical protein [Texcoconibacillus texcoconensis]